MQTINKSNKSTNCSDWQQKEKSHCKGKENDSQRWMCIIRYKSLFMIIVFVHFPADLHQSNWICPPVDRYNCWISCLVKHYCTLQLWLWKCVWKVCMLFQPIIPTLYLWYGRCWLKIPCLLFIISLLLGRMNFVRQASLWGCAKKASLSTLFLLKLTFWK